MVQTENSHAQQSDNVSRSLVSWTTFQFCFFRLQSSLALTINHNTRLQQRLVHYHRLQHFFSYIEMINIWLIVVKLILNNCNAYSEHRVGIFPRRCVVFTKLKKCKMFYLCTLKTTWKYNRILVTPPVRPGWSCSDLSRTNLSRTAAWRNTYFKNHE